MFDRFDLTWRKKASSTVGASGSYTAKSYTSEPFAGVRAGKARSDGSAEKVQVGKPWSTRHGQVDQWHLA